MVGKCEWFDPVGGATSGWSRSRVRLNGNIRRCNLLNRSGPRILWLCFSLNYLDKNWLTCKVRSLRAELCVNVFLRTGTRPIIPSRGWLRAHAVRVKGSLILRGGTAHCLVEGLWMRGCLVMVISSAHVKFFLIKQFFCIKLQFYRILNKASVRLLISYCARAYLIPF